MAVRLKPCDLSRLRRLAEDRLPPDEVVGTGRALAALCRLSRSTGRPGRRRALARGGPPLPRGRSDRALRREPAAVDFDDAPGSLAPSDWPDSLGRLGSYEVKGVIGRGGMGVVLKAFDPALNRNVAIKVLSPPPGHQRRRRGGGSSARRRPRRRSPTSTSSRSTPSSRRPGCRSWSWNTSPAARSRTGSTGTGRWRWRRSSGSACRRRPAWPPRMPRGWSTATSSRPTSCWRTASSGSS